MLNSVFSVLLLIESRSLSSITYIQFSMKGRSIKDAVEMIRKSYSNLLSENSSVWRFMRKEAVL